MLNPNLLSNIGRLTVTISGEQGSGKTLLAKAIKELLHEAGKSSYVVEEGLFAPAPPGTDVLIKVMSNVPEKPSIPAPIPKFKLGDRVSANKGSGVDPSIVFVVKNSYPGIGGSLSVYQLESADGNYAIYRFSEGQLVEAKPVQYPTPVFTDRFINPDLCRIQEAIQNTSEPDTKAEAYPIGKIFPLVGTYKYADFLTLAPGAVAKIIQRTVITNENRTRGRLDVMVEGMFIPNIPTDVFERKCTAHRGIDGMSISG